MAAKPKPENLESFLPLKGSRVTKIEIAGPETAEERKLRLR